MRLLLYQLAITENLESLQNKSRSHLIAMPQNMDVESVVKIEGYSVKNQEENGNGQAQSNKIKSAVFITQVPILPGPCGFQNNDSTSPPTISFHPEIGSASNHKGKINADESPLTMTNDVDRGSSRKEEVSAEEKFKCFIPNCSMIFADKNTLKIHLIYDHRENWFKCHLCESAFLIEFDFITHLVTHSTAQPYVCNVCSKLCQNIQDLREHEQKHHITNKVTQSYGSEQPLSLQCSESAETVMLTLTPITILPTITPSSSLGATASGDVGVCSKSPTEKRSKLVIHEPHPLKQPENTKNFTNNRRKEEASAEKKLKCSVPNCCKSFSKNSALKEHLISHSTARPHHCNACSKSFKYIKDLRIHERKVHHISFSCTKKRKLVNRERHEPNQLLKTQPQMSTTTTTLSLPYSTNEIEAESVLIGPTTSPKAPLLKVNPTNKCDVCLKDFISRQALGGHRRQVHTAENEKRHKCHVCAISSVSRLRLKQHLYFVHGEKSENLKIFKCEFCGREFPSVSRLENHVVDKHVVDKEFECSECSKTFVDQEILTKHRVKIHEQKIINYFCDVCSARFTSRKVLGGHLKNFHKILYCFKCVRSFESKSKFNQHSNSEATLNLNAGFKLQCQVCFVSLSTQCNFNIHTDGHLREKKSSAVA